MVKETNNLIYEFISGDANEITKVVTALHNALRGNKLYIHSKIVLHWAEDGFVMVDIKDVESCYKQLPKFLTTYAEFNKFVKNVIDDPCKTVSETNYGETNNSDLQSHCENQRKEINQLLKANEDLKKEIQELKTRLGSVFAEKEKVRGNYERLRQDNLGLKPFEKAYDELKNNYEVIKEAYKKLDDRYNREKENWSEKHNEFQDSINLKNRRIASLEQGTKTQSDVINQKNSEIRNLKVEIENWKEACLRHQVDVNNFQGDYTEATEKVKILNENIEHLERENEHLRELYFCTVENNKKIIDKLRKEKE